MEYLSALTYHLAHPFSVKVGNDEVSLSPTEKQIAATTAAASLALGLLSGPIALVAAPVAFYGMTAGFKRHNLDKYKPSEETLKTDAVSTLYPPFTSSSASNDLSLESEPSPYSSDNDDLYEEVQNGMDSEEMDTSFPSSSAYVASQSSSGDNLADDIRNVMLNNKIMARDKKAVISDLFDQTNRMTVFQDHLKHIFDNLNDKQKLEFIKGLPNYLQDPFFKPFLTRYFDIHSIPGDGNCCVYALVQAQNDNTLNDEDEKQFAHILREQVVSHIRQNRNSYEPFCEDFEAYVENMSRDKEWFGPQEIKAFAESAEVPVIIYNPNNVCLDAQNQLRPYAESILGAEYSLLTPKRIYLYHKEGNHYELLIPKRQITPPPPMQITV